VYWYTIVKSIVYQIKNTLKYLSEIQDGDWDRAADLMGSGTRDSAETLETHLAEVKHKGEQKIWHSKSLDRGRLLHTTL
jgi:hypothetical protein